LPFFCANHSIFMSSCFDDTVTGDQLDLYIFSMNERKEYRDGKNAMTEKIHGGELNEFSLRRQCKGNLLQKHFLQRCTSANPTASRMQGLRMSRWYGIPLRGLWGRNIMKIQNDRERRSLCRLQSLVEAPIFPLYTVKKVSRDVTNQTLSGGE
jgi:hypothetical protein